MMSKPKNRWQAFAIHLSISALIFIVLAALIYFVWYPGFLFYADGGIQGMKIIAGVDLVLGPVLTLLVYDKTKKSLRFDLACVAAVQLCCLCIGMWVVYKEKPFAVIYANQTFQTLHRLSFEQYGISTEELTKQFGPPPVKIYIELPTDPLLASEDIKNQFTHGPLVFQRNRYRTYSESIQKILQDPLPDSTLVNIPTNIRPLYHLEARYVSGFVQLNARGDITKILKGNAPPTVDILSGIKKAPD